ncbi:MAG: DUF1080 domain-containing protein [Verrucomicrobia bacterium]|nr:DUF1080 domain-containing protein [Verrucomicrobiota bacterium]
MSTPENHHRRAPLSRRTFLKNTALAAGAAATGPSLFAAAKPVRLFNGKNLDGWYTYTVETKYENPGIFTVVDGMVRVSGGSGDKGYFGGLVTKAEYENYKLTFDYKWGGPTYGTRKDKSRDAGVLLHCTGPNEPGPWMTSYEFQIIEGGTGDILVVNYAKRNKQENAPTLKLVSEGYTDAKKQKYFKEGGEKLEFTDSGRLNWWGRDPEWKDVVDFRGRQDVESPFGQWTKCEILCKADTLVYHVNGRLVNRARGLTVTKGKIFFQTEGAEVWYRNLELTPLG